MNGFNQPYARERSQKRRLAYRRDNVQMDGIHRIQSEIGFQNVMREENDRDSYNPNNNTDNNHTVISVETTNDAKNVTRSSGNYTENLIFGINTFVFVTSVLVFSISFSCVYQYFQTRGIRDVKKCWHNCKLD